MSHSNGHARGWSYLLLFLSRSNGVQTASQHQGSAATKGTERGSDLPPLGQPVLWRLRFPRAGGSNLARAGCRAGAKGSAACFSLSLQPGDGGAEPVGMSRLSSACGGGLCLFLCPQLSGFSAELSLWSREGAGRAACSCPPSWGGRGGPEPLHSMGASQL